jgi:hypothetical protein
MKQSIVSKQENLRRALMQFSQTGRYPLLRDVEVERLLPEGLERETSLRGLTFGQLVEQYITSDDWCDPQLFIDLDDRVLHLVLALVEESTEHIPSRSQSTHLERHPAISIAKGADAHLDDELEHVDIQSSVQLELELRRLLQAITTDPKYQSIRQRCLGEFWSKDWTPAPFEEALTIGQLSTMDISVLFKKKMVSDDRISNICRALRRVQEELSAVSGSEQVPPRMYATACKSEFERFPSGDMSAESLCLWEVLARARREKPYPELHGFIDSFLREFSFEECLVIARGDAPPTPTLKKLSTLVGRELSPTANDLVTAVLRGPGARLDDIAAALHPSRPQISAISRVAAVVVARGLGAVPVVLPTGPVPGFWTMNPQICSDLTARGARKLSEKLSSLALDPILQEIMQTHGRSCSKRTDKRNRLKRRRQGGK